MKKKKKKSGGRRKGNKKGEKESFQKDKHESTRDKKFKLYTFT